MHTHINIHIHTYTHTHIYIHTHIFEYLMGSTQSIILKKRPISIIF